MIYGSQNYHVVRDITDLIGIRTLLLRKYWQATGEVRTQADLDAQKPAAPSVPGGVLLMGEQTIKERGRFATIWTFQGINGDGKGVTFKRRGESWDYGFEPGFAQVPVQVNRFFDRMLSEFQGYPSNDGTTVIWPPELKEQEGGGLSREKKRTGLNPMFGIQSYFEMEGVYRYRYAERDLPTTLFNGVGYIATDVPGDTGGLTSAGAGGVAGALGLGGGGGLNGKPGKDGRNFLKAPPAWQRKGIVYDITEFFWLSRRGGWPEPVYREGYFQ